MANPVFIASAKAKATNAGTTGVTVTHGFTLANDDLLYAFVMNNDNLGTGWASSSGGTWTQLLAQSTALGNDRHTAILRRVVTNAAGEPATYTFTNDTAISLAHVGIVVQVRDGDTTTPEDVTTVGSTGQNDFTPDNIDITTVTTGALVLAAHFATTNDGLSSAKVGGAPSGFTLITTEFNADQVTEPFIEVAYDADTIVGAQTIGVWTGTADDATSEFDTYAAAVRPEPAVGGGTYSGWYGAGWI